MVFGEFCALDFNPDVDELYNRVSKIDPKISIATVYRTVKLFEESGILAKHEFKGGKARYEELNEGHHDHLIDVKSGEIIEFVDEEIEKLQKKGWPIGLHGGLSSSYGRWPIGLHGGLCHGPMHAS